MSVRIATAADLDGWAVQRQALWPDDGLAMHRSGAEAMLNEPDQLGLVAVASDGAIVGFAEAAIRRDYVNGCESSPVGFLEGIHVTPDARRHGHARALCAAAEGWARSRGCREFASDAEIDNHDSHAMHAALGFEETERVVCFRKILD